MILLRRVCVPIGAALVTAVLATPAMAAPASTLFESAHVGFDDPNTGRTLTVDLGRVNGVAQLDVEYWSRSCTESAGLETCETIFRNAYDQTPSRVRMSLQGASATGVVTYSQTVRTCTYGPVDEEGERPESCTDAPATTGTTSVKITWTGTGEVVKERWNDEEGARYVTRRRTASVVGTAFGESFPVEQSLITSLSRTRKYAVA
ncbi:hypothetical protein [Actinoplanes regularis]|uniref:Secreted protein n=1 Tax=Actinoplanes regularis TaxID=52697 RepID=A0A238YRW7_9ACTN|nr:hypothetical protein [Actinoplanes regularis]GIE85518.1 hypothetical protein Are01nite_19980 [Actinoplanes regularis]SNR73885.1 hypothetical protein SAMN06264365_105139 [Actinoplanes regularis]